MTKYLLIAIRPEWLYLILTGKKLIELRKVIPNWVKEEIAKGNTVKCLFYCTKAKPNLIMPFEYDAFPMDEASQIYLGEKFIDEDILLNGKIVAEFDLQKIEDLVKYAFSFKDSNFYNVLEKACLTPEELHKYAPISHFDNLSKKHIYALHIDKLTVFDKPKELHEYHYYKEVETVLTRAPQNCCCVYGE